MDEQLLMVLPTFGTFRTKSQFLVQLLPQVAIDCVIKPLNFQNEQSDSIGLLFDDEVTQYQLIFGSSDDAKKIVQGKTAHMTLNGILHDLAAAGAQSHWLISHQSCKIRAQYGSLWAINDAANPGVWLKSINTFTGGTAWLKAYATLDELQNFARVSFAKYFDPLEASILKLDM